jgi:hypothetical protein
MEKLLRCAALAALVSSLAACGGGGSSEAQATGGGTQETVTGVQTPSSVSVVTARNAQ